ncbi:MAG: GAF domain-containing sensor histidine kinase [Nitrospirae bacterium]|nr:GAF domain-containing sensor histidine kinase [Nitrospirota bacterium]
MNGITYNELLSSLSLSYKQIESLSSEKAELKRTKRALKAIVEFNRLLQHKTDELNLLKDTCKLIIDIAKYHMVWIGFCWINQNNEKVVSPVATYGYDEGYVENTKIAWDDSGVAQGPTDIAVRTGKPSVCRHILTDKEYEPWKAEALKRGFKSSIAIPLILEEQVIGALNIYATEADAFDKEELSLLMELSNDLSIGISTIRKRAKNKDNENKLLEINKKLEQMIMNEIHKRMQQEQFLIQQSKMAAMGEMISVISHQWRTPLNCLSLVIQDIKEAYRHDELTGGFINDTVSKSMNFIRFMSETLDNFRNFLTPSKTKVEFSVRKAADEILQMFSDLFSRDNIIITLEAEDESESYFIFGYPNEFKQVILNIINNSRDALIMAKKGLSDKNGYGRIFIRLKKRDSKVIIILCDNGGGIEEDVANRIFEHYFTTKATDGTGVGLYISKTIIENNMGGSLTFRNIDGGAEFKIVI